MKKGLLVALTIFMVVALAACGGGGVKAALVGTWYAASEENEQETLGAGFEFKKDGTIGFDFAGLQDAMGMTAEEYAEYKEKIKRNKQNRCNWLLAYPLLPGYLKWI